MKARIETLKAEVLDLQKKGIQYNILKREAESNRGIYNSLLQRYKEVDIAGGVGTNNIFVVDRAAVPIYPSEPNVPRSLILSLALGLGTGVGLALFLELLDDRVRAPEEIEQLFGLATLGVIPRIESQEMAEAIGDPRSALAESYRSLATALQFSTNSGLPRSISVTSAGPGEGKSTTVVAIARHFAQMGLKVLLIDADLRKPSLHKKLNLSNAIGLSNYLTGTSLPPELIQKTDHPNLAFMASGPLPPNAADLLSGTRVHSLISLGSEVFDLIVLDSPPLLGLADAQLLAGAVAANMFRSGSRRERQRHDPLGAKAASAVPDHTDRRCPNKIRSPRPLAIPMATAMVWYGYGYGYKGYSYSYGNLPEAEDGAASKFRRMVRNTRPC